MWGRAQAYTGSYGILDRSWATDGAHTHHHHNMALDCSLPKASRLLQAPLVRGNNTKGRFTKDPLQNKSKCWKNAGLPGNIPSHTLRGLQTCPASHSDGHPLQGDWQILRQSPSVSHRTPRCFFPEKRGNGGDKQRIRSPQRRIFRNYSQGLRITSHRIVA